jgi:hypothetical protein
MSAAGDSNGLLMKRLVDRTRQPSRVIAMSRFFTSRSEFVSTLTTALHFLSCISFVAWAALSFVIYVFGVPRTVDADRVALMGLPAIGGIAFFHALRIRLLRRPCRTRYGTIAPLEPGWSTFVNAQLFAGVVLFAFGIIVIL